MNSNEMQKRAEALCKIMWDQQKADDLFKQAIEIVDRAIGGNLNRDHVRTLGVTNKILEEFASKRKV